MPEKHKTSLRKTYLSLLLLLTAGFLLFAAYSFTEDSGNGVGLVRTDINRFLDSPFWLPDSVYVEEYDEADTVAAVPADTVPKRILLLGDSMVEGLSKPFGRYAAMNGHDLTSVVWYSSSSRTWAMTDTLEFFIKKYRPDFIMISLGGNELFVRDLNDRQKYVSDIVARISDIPFIWIGPPNWKEDTGINGIVRNAVGEKRFFESRRLSFERGADGRHPTPESSCMWADTISSWIMNTSCYRIRMTCPSDSVGYKGRVIVLSNARF